MQPKPKNGGDGLYWLIALILIFTGAGAPIGVLMLVLKLLGGEKRHNRQAYYTQEQAGPVGARTTGWAPVPPRYSTPPQNARAWEPQPQPARPQAPAQPPKSPSEQALASREKTAKALIAAGAGVSVLFGLGALSIPSEVLPYLLQGSLRWALNEFLDGIPLLCFLAAGLGTLAVGLRRRRQVRRFRAYLAMIGNRKMISISSLTSATGLSPSTVREDLATMLDCGVLPQGFLDYGGDRLILSGEGLLEEEEPPKKAAPEPPKESPENAILEEIRDVNRMIDNEKLSAQIDRIGVITARILDFQRSHPEKAPQLHSFLSYYLPTTLKILRAYAQLEDQEVSGANITSAMHRIEGMMDKVVEGFEKQLDLLFQGDAMDITADVEVLERMLAMDGLSSGQEGSSSGQGGITLTL